jgi:hypothetical protein
MRRPCRARVDHQPFGGISPVPRTIPTISEC